MATYHITQEPRNRIQKVRDSAVFTIIWIIGFSSVERYVKGRWDDAEMLAITGSVLFVGTLLTKLLWERESPEYKLVMDDYGIQSFLNGKMLRTVRRERVRYVGEWGSGRFRRLVISERGPAFTRWLWGGLGVPASLPEYEQVKAHVYSWLQDSEI